MLWFVRFGSAKLGIWFKTTKSYMWRLENSDCHIENKNCDTRMENIMFDFRIIEMETGNQIIDWNLKTPYTALTPLQMVEYIEMDVQLAVMDMMERKAKEEAECKRKLVRNSLYKIACLCGLV